MKAAAATPSRRSGARADLRERTRSLALALASAILTGSYASRPELAFLPYVGLVPWSILYTDPKRPRVSSGYYVFSAWLYWMISYRHTFARFGLLAQTILSVLGLAGFLWLFGPLLKRLHARFAWPRTLSVPLAWVAMECLRGLFTIGHFDYLSIGYSQARFPILIQIADVVGVYGVSFLVASVNGLLADAYFAARDREGSVREALLGRRIVWTAASVAAAFALVLAYGGYRTAGGASQDGPRVAVIQPSVRHTIRNAVGVHLTQTLLTEERLAPGAADLIVWPENAILDDIRREGAYLDDLAWLATRKGAPIVLGSSAASPGNPLRQTNSAFMVDSKGSIVGQYDKQVLLPFSEYVPFEKTVERCPLAVKRLYLSTIRNSWGFLPNGTRGADKGLFALPWRGGAIPFAALTCWENVYPPVVSEARRKGARFGVHLTSESEVGGVLHEHTLRVCILRAVENRLPYVRAANTGISCFIDSRGRVMNILRGPGDSTSVAGVLVDRVGLAEEGLTLYTRSHGAFEKACAFAGLGLFLSTFARRRPAAAALAVVAIAALATGCGRAVGGEGGPAGPASAIEAARHLAEHGRLDAAVREYRDACAVESACRDAIGPAATALRRLDDADLGLAFFDTVAERHPSLRGEALGYRAFFLERKNRYRESRECFEEAIAAGASPQVRALYGDLLRRGGELGDAEREFREALRLGLDEPRLLSRLARTVRAQGRDREAIAILEPVVAAHAEFGPAWVELGRARLGAGDRPGAVAAFEKAIEAEPAAVEARFMLAKLALREGRDRDAERYAREIASIEATLGRGPRED